MQFNNDITRKVAQEAARIMAEAQKGSHPKTEKEKDLAALGHPKDKITHKDVLIGRGVLKKEEKELDEALVGNQHRIDANKNNKIDAHDFKLLRAKRKMKEETELTESHFKVGDEVVCKASGMEGEVVKVDPKGEGKYYTVKREDGKTMKYAPDELKKDDEDEDEDKKVNEATSKQENKFHKKLDKLVHGTFGKSSDEKMKKEEVEQIDELKKSTLQSYAGKVIDKTRTMPQGAKKQKHLAGLGKAMDKMKEEVEELDEISPGLAARAASGASDPDYEGRASHENIARMATKKFGTKIGGQISNTEKGHWPKEYGSSKRSAPSGIDKLSWRKPTRTTASGKANKQDISALKNRMKEEVELDEALWPGTPEYEKKFPKESKPGARRQTQDYGYQGKEEEHGQTTFRKEVKPAKRGKYGARQNYIRSRKISGKTLKDDVEVGFVDILEAYDTHGLKFIAAMMREEPDNEEFTKEYEDQKKSMEGKKKQPDVAKASVQAVKQEETEVDEGVLGSIAAGVGQFIGNKIDPTHGEMLRTHGPEVVRQLRYHATNAVNKVKNKIKKEEVEEIEERTLTEPETAKKEEIVKSMKKGVKGFKQRYGERAKSVMYATATKIAKEKA